MRTQFSDRTRYVTCPECQGRSWNDPSKVWHWKDCSRYREWRFGKREGGAYRGSPGTGRGAGSEPDPRPYDSVLEDYFRELPGGGE